MKKSTTSSWEGNINVTMIDQNKINTIVNKRHKIIMFIDELQLKHTKDLLTWYRKISRLDKELEKARKGKTIKKQLKQNG